MSYAEISFLIGKLTKPEEAKLHLTTAKSIIIQNLKKIQPIDEKDQFFYLSNKKDSKKVKDYKKFIESIVVVMSEIES